MKTSTGLVALVGLAGLVTGACENDAFPLGGAEVLATGEPVDAGAPEVTVAEPVPDPCRNGVVDGDETDVDCGGSVCPACANGQACARRADCASLVCAAGVCTGDVGCADGTREGFAELAAYPNIAACAGAWSVPGVLPAATYTPACDRLAGNDGANAAGTGCNVADLCQDGWHVCTSPDDVAASTGGRGCAGLGAGEQFYVTRQSGAGAGACAADGANDLFGCGGAGAPPDAVSCGPFDRFSNDLCVQLPATWSCGADAFGEANNVTKTSSDGGGVLCCRG